MTGSFRVVNVGDKVQSHPATDAWMQGDRFGEVVKVGRKYVHVKMDSGKIRRFTTSNLLVTGR
jgi:hypothetical protein